MIKVYLCLGSNVGDRGANIDNALRWIEERKIQILKKSRLYETEPVEVVNQEWFYNQVIEVETDMPPGELLLELKKIEAELGRKYTYKWGPRLIDIDILIYGNRKVNTSVLRIPHLLMDRRKFVLVPFNEIAPEVAHPVLKKTIKELLNECKDTAIVRPL